LQKRKKFNTKLSELDNWMTKLLGIDAPAQDQNSSQMSLLLQLKMGLRFNEHD